MTGAASRAFTRDSSWPISSGLAPAAARSISSASWRRDSSTFCRRSAASASNRASSSAFQALAFSGLAISATESMRSSRLANVCSSAFRAVSVVVSARCSRSWMRTKVLSIEVIAPDTSPSTAFTRASTVSTFVANEVSSAETRDASCREAPSDRSSACSTAFSTR